MDMGKNKMKYDKKEKIKVVHGDSAELIPQYCENNSIDLIATDPPY